MAAASASLTVTVVALLGGAGALPSAAEPQAGGAIAPSAQTVDDRTSSSTSSSAGAQTAPATNDAPTGGQPLDETSSEELLPADSGKGRRIVYSEGRQRVWLVGEAGKVRRTYLVSGSIYDNLDPGTYSVYSRSQQAWGIDDSGTMKYFVRFAHGDTAAIGFHDIPVDDGRRVQTVDDLGTPQSHGCIRQKRSDAIALWNFAPVGTPVIVVD
jgi:lipoprotein-anchoring transpeptidase ErfK/SrfK